jgi:hypothetical protein
MHSEGSGSIATLGIAWLDFGQYISPRRWPYLPGLFVYLDQQVDE